jgi:peptidoglycan/LPS O-acetylase OafA/YrhL
MEENKLEEIKPEDNTQTIFTGDDFSMDGYDKHIRQARNAIFVAAGILLLNLIILLYNLPGGYEYAWIDILLWGAFIAGFIVLGFWTKKKPYYAIIGALVLYGGFILLNAVIDANTIFKGIIFKIAIIVYLIKALSDAKEAQQMKAQMEK